MHVAFGNNTPLVLGNLLPYYPLQTYRVQMRVQMPQGAMAYGTPPLRPL
jgi:hypothetical protein